MPNTSSIIIGIVILAVATYLMRASSLLFNGRFSLSAQVKTLLSMGAIVILFSVGTTMTFFDGQSLSDIPKIVGVAVAGILTWYKKPFIAIVLSAAITTGLLRYLLTLIQ